MGMGVAAKGTFKRFAGMKDKLVAGHYENLAIAVNGGLVTGFVRDSIGDPEHGGATCEFTIAGKLGGDQRSTAVVVTDAYDSYQGKLLIKDERNIALSVPQL